MNTFALKIVNMHFQKLKPEVEEILQNKAQSIEDRLTAVCELLEQNIPYYDWVGFYFKNGDKEELKLKSFAGEPTDHDIIPFGKGICGQVAVSNKNFVVPDVKAQNNYIACSIHVKAEIVIPLFVNGENIGQIDIDSHTEDPFSHEDELFLEWVNEKVAEIL
jgi:L-methionine (R)-S-oxide reductase